MTSQRGLGLLEDQPDDDDEELEIIESTTEAKTQRLDYVSGMWNRYGYDHQSTTDKRDQALITAHQMVQTFINTFATSGGYVVAFSDAVGVAGTDLSRKRVVVSPAPVYDTTLTPQQAGVLMTAVSAHEASHDRYGRGTWLACRRVFGEKRGPHTLSNLLDDVRIERRFAIDYPGYADVFRPMIEYVGAATNKRMRVDRYRPSLGAPINLAVCAVRYPDFCNWKRLEKERDWWQAWAARWAREDAPRRHVEGVREGLSHALVTKRTAKHREATGQVQRLRRNLSRLTPQARKALRLSAQGKTGDQIAAELDVAVDEARTILRSARILLAEEGR